MCSCSCSCSLRRDTPHRLPLLLVGRGRVFQHVVDDSILYLGKVRVDAGLASPILEAFTSRLELENLLAYLAKCFEAALPPSKVPCH